MKSKYVVGDFGDLYDIGCQKLFYSVSLGFFLMT